MCDTNRYTKIRCVSLNRPRKSDDGGGGKLRVGWLARSLREKNRGCCFVLNVRAPYVSTGWTHARVRKLEATANCKLTAWYRYLPDNSQRDKGMIRASITAAVTATIVAVSLSSLCVADGFIFQHQSLVATHAPSSRPYERHHHSTSLSAKASAKKGKSKKGGGGFGAGFGSKTSADNTQGKVRSVSGYTGSGTKPLRVAANTFDAIRKKYGKEACSDIYVRTLVNDSNTFWFVGKLARRTDPEDPDMRGESIPTEMEAALSQKRLIFEYAKKLRPQNLDGPYAKDLELWLAPPDSEMDVVQNKVSLTKVAGSTKDISDSFSVADVGYNPEIYVGDEVKEGGLRVTRDDEGHPVKPVFEINN